MARRLKPGEAALPRIAYAEAAVAAYVRKVRRRTRRMLPVIAVLVVLRRRAGRGLAGFDAMVDGLDVYGPGSRAGDHGERERWHRDG